MQWNSILLFVSLFGLTAQVAASGHGNGRLPEGHPIVKRHRLSTDKDCAVDENPFCSVTHPSRKLVDYVKTSCSKKLSESELTAVHTLLNPQTPGQKKVDPNTIFITYVDKKSPSQKRTSLLNFAARYSKDPLFIDLLVCDEPSRIFLNIAHRTALERDEEDPVKLQVTFLLKTRFTTLREESDALVKQEQETGPIMKRGDLARQVVIKKDPRVS